MSETLVGLHAQYPDPALDEILRAAIGVSARELLALAIFAVMAIQVGAYWLKQRKQRR